MKKTLFPIITIILLLLAIAFISPISKQNSQEMQNNKIIKGVSLSPKSFQGDDFTNFFAKAKETGDIISWVGDGYQLGAENAAPEVLMQLSQKYGYIPVVITAFDSSDPSFHLLRSLNNETAKVYQDKVVEFAQKYHPQYLGIGNEINTLYEKSPISFDRFVVLYSDTYDAIKAVSPETKIFPIFQLEKMKGLQGGLFGGDNRKTNAEWSILEKFGKADLIGFTTYPGLIYKNPLDIPTDHYSEILQYTSKPVIFTEIGWHSAGSPKGWESTEEKQAKFIPVFTALTDKLQKTALIWSFMYDQNTAEPFNSMGLITKTDSNKPAFDAWKKL